VTPLDESERFRIAEPALFEIIDAHVAVDERARDEVRSAVVACSRVLISPRNPCCCV